MVGEEGEWLSSDMVGRLSVGIREERKSNRGRCGWYREKKRPAAVGIGLWYWISIRDAYRYHVRIKKEVIQLQ